MSKKLWIRTKDNNIYCIMVYDHIYRITEINEYHGSKIVAQTFDILDLVKPKDMYVGKSKIYTCVKDHYILQATKNENGEWVEHEKPIDLMGDS